MKLQEKVIIISTGRLYYCALKILSQNLMSGFGILFLVPFLGSEDLGYCERRLMDGTY